MMVALLDVLPAPFLKAEKSTLLLTVTLKYLIWSAKNIGLQSVKMVSVIAGNL